MKGDPNSNILPFAQDAGFYVRRARARVESGAFVAAASLYRRALQMDPSDSQARLELGVLYSDMGCPGLSNRELCEAIWRGAEDDPQLYYKLACNYVDMHLYDAALCCFAEMIRCRDEREFEFDRDLSGVFAAIIDESERLSEEERRKIAHLCAGAMEDLEKNDKKGAIAKFERVWAADPSSAEQAGNLAMACYCDGQYARARSVCSRALLYDRGNLQIHCILALVCFAQKDEAGLRQEVDFLQGAEPENQSETLKIAVTLCDINRYQNALELLQRQLQALPYAVDLLYCAGVCAHNLNQLEPAEDYFSRAAAVDEKDPVLRCAIEQTRLESEKKQEFRPILSAIRELPLNEMLRYTRLLHDAQEMSAEELRADPDLKQVLYWALCRKDARRIAALSALSTGFPAWAEEELRTLLCDCSTDDEDRQVFLALLATLGCKGPFTALMEQGIARITVNVFHGLEELSDEYREVPELFVRHSTDRGAPEDCVKSGIEIWRRFVEDTVRTGAQKKKQLNVPAYAAALSYVAWRSVKPDGKTVTQSAACREYGVSLWHFKKALSSIKNACITEEKT